VLAIDDLAAVPPALHLGRSAKRLASTVRLYTDGSEDLAKALEAGLHEQEKDCILTDTRRIAKLIKGAEGSTVTICFQDGSTPATESFLVHRPRMELNGPFAQQLGLEISPQGHIQTTPPFGETSVKGVFAAGDCATPGKIVANALATGAFAGAGVAAQLQASPF
jgi:gliotoxin/aspirochlorine biosynthesis thioredoxin reductase